MENNFLNQNVEVLVSFAGAFRDSGYSPVAYVGQLIGVDDNYIMVKSRQSKQSLGEKYKYLW